MNLVKTYRNILQEGLGSIKVYDFSQANINYNSRVKAITDVASVCFGKDEAKKPEALYQRLIKESMGLPSSSFEFVPILISEEKYIDLLEPLFENELEEGEYYEDFWRFSDGIKVNDKRYILTNLRNCLNIFPDDIVNQLFNNTEEEINIIKDNYFVFKIECDIVTARQWVRHRIFGSYNEKSRRYTKDLPQIYTPVELSKTMVEDVFGNFQDVENYIQLSLKMYEKALTQTSAQNARYLLPLGLMTTFWVGGTKRYWEHFIKLRTDKHSQREIRAYAEVIKNELKGVLNG